MISTGRGTAAKLAFSNSVGFSAATAVPIWIGQVGAFGLSPWQGFSASFAQLICAAVSNALTPILAGRHSSAVIGRTAAGSAVVGQLLAATGIPILFAIGLVIAGSSLGALLAATNRIMAQTENAHANFSLVYIIESFFAGSFYLLGPLIVHVGSLHALFVTLALLATIAFLFLVQIASRHVDASEDHTSSAIVLLHAAPILGLLGFICLMTGQSLVWLNAVALGAGVGIDPIGVGRVMAASVAAGLCGALASRALGVRMGLFVPLAFACAALAVSVVYMGVATSSLQYIVGAVGVATFTFLTMPYLFALLARVEPTGRAAAMGPACLLTGTSVAPSITAAITQGSSKDVAAITGGLVIGIAIALFSLSARITARTAPSPGLWPAGER